MLNVIKPKYSKEEFYNEIIRIYKIENKINKRLFEKYTNTDIQFEYYAYKFGGIRKICKELSLNHNNNHYSKQEIAQSVLDIYNRFGYITKELYEKEGKYSYCSIRNIFGGLNNVLKYLNIPLNVIYNPTKEEIKQDVLNFCNRFNTTNSSDYRKHGKYNQKYIDEFFNGWVNLMKELDFKPLKNKIGLDNMIVEIKKIYNKYGYISSKLINEECSFTYQAFSVYFDNKEEMSCAISNKKDIFNNDNFSTGIKQVLFYLEKIIDTNLIIKEKTFDWLKTKDENKMYIDIFIDKYDICIEYNGKQHYEYVEFFHKTHDNFIKSQERDRLKYELIKKNNKKLIIIKYDEKITKELIESKLKNIID